MAVISVEVLESEEQIISGIPRVLFVSTNISSNIFYTLDGTVPDTNSSIYIDGIKLPTNLFDVYVKIFATNGVDSSAIIELEYSSVSDVEKRRTHASTDSSINKSSNLLFPFGSDNSADKSRSEYFSSGDTGITVNDVDVANLGFTGYGSDGYQTGQSDLDMTLENYRIKYEYDSNMNYVGVGTLPAKSTFIRKQDYEQEGDIYDPLFNPKSMVIYQDVSEEDLDSPPVVNKMFFSLEDTRAKDGSAYYNTSAGGDVFSGSFLRQHFNPRDNTMTYYYRDNKTNQWIISKMPYTPSRTAGNLANYIVSRSGGAAVILPWIPFARRYLF